MKRLIDANELLKKKFLTREFDATARGWTLEVVSAKDIEDAPSIDSESLRPHGRWEMNSDRPDSLICSVCNCGFDMWKHDPHNYCPNCGAKMDGVGDE